MSYRNQFRKTQFVAPIVWLLNRWRVKASNVKWATGIFTAQYKMDICEKIKKLSSAVTKHKNKEQTFCQD